MLFGILKLTTLGLLFAAADTGQDWFSYANRVTGFVILVGIAIGAYRGWWVPGWRYKEIKDERDKLLDLALKSQETSHRALNTAEKVIQ